MNKAIEAADARHLVNRLSQMGYAFDSIKASEKPDFILTANGRQVGLEVTRSVNEDTMRALKLQREKFPFCGICFPNRIRQGPQLNKEDLAKSLLSLVPKAPPAVSPLLEWQRRINKTLIAKRNKLNQPDYQNFDEDWLLIYDILPPILERIHDSPERLLLQMFEQTPKPSKDFDVVFVNSRDFLFRWSGGALDWVKFDDPVALVLC